MENTKNSSRLEWIDILRFTAIVCVIIIHSQGAFKGTAHGSENWWIFNVINSLSHFSVPVFVMISGALLLKHDIPLSIFLRKRFSRIIFPFIFWSIILFIGNILLKRPLSQRNLLFSFFSDLFGNKINYVYWYIYMLIGLYLITPVLTKWVHNIKVSEIKYFLLIWSFTLFLFLFSAQKDFAVDLSYFSGYIGYFILGYYLSVIEINSRKKRQLALLLILSGGIITIFGNYFFRDATMEAYLTPNIMMLSTGIFLLVKESTLPRILYMDKLIIKISRYSYGIYLIHVVAISMLSRFQINSLFVSPYVGTFIVATIALIISILFLEVFKRIPLTKYISGI